MNYKIVILIGIAMMVEGFLASLYSSTVLLVPSEPPLMRPIEGLDYVLMIYRQAFFISGIFGIVVTISGIVLWRKRK